MQNQNMEDIDNDLVVDIPDTPDRFAAQHANDGKIARKESTSLTGRFRNSNFQHEELLNRPMLRSRIATETGHVRRLQMHPPKAPGNIVEIESPDHTSNHSRLFRKTTTDKNSKEETRNSFGGHHVNKGKAICDEKFLAKEKREGQMAHSSSLHFTPNISKTYGSELKGKEKVEEASYNFGRSDSATNNGKGADLSNNSPHRMEKQHAVIQPRVSGRKRLVRNGCISPQNIATMMQQPADHSKKTIEAKAAEPNQTINVASNGPSSLDISQIVSEDDHRDRFKGKRVSNEHDAEVIDLSGSTPRNRCKEAHRTGGTSRDLVGSCLDLGGWRRTHNPTRNIDGLSPDDVGSRFAKRQKNELPSRNSDGIVGMGSGGSDIVFLDSAGRSSSSSTSTIRNHQHRGIPTPIVNIDDLSPVMRHTDAQASRTNNQELDTRMRQLEVDEALARELQEQLYSEATILGGSEIDENMAWSLQQEDVLAAPSTRSRPAPRPRISTRTQSNRNPMLRSLQNPSNRTGIQARAPARRTHLRSRILGRSRPPPASMPRDVQFPMDMDLDMRMEILEALEAAVGDFSDMGGASHILQLQRDFNENDYEMLLALDDNNHLHGGASTNLINSLPESTVRTENFEECAVCLETPNIGETIRHLPCLHKFHKECIDPWLTRKTSCPVCKSSLT